MLKTKLFDASLNERDLFGLKELFFSGELNSGLFIPELESRLSKLYKRRYCFCLSDMTAAISQLLLHLNVQPGDSILCHPFSCLSTTMAVKLVGARPEWIKLDYDTMSLDLKALESHATNARVLVNYNVAGYIPDFIELERICENKSIKIINDCNNAELSKFHGKFALEYGDYAIMSFYPNRWFGAVDGGAILSNINMRGFHKNIRLGVDKKNYRNEFGAFNKNHDIEVIAGSNNMHNVSARIVLNKIAQMSEIRSRAEDVYNYLYDHFKEYTVERIPDCDVIPWLFPISAKTPSKAIENLRRLGLETTELHFLNDRYSIFSPSDNEHEVTRMLWLPMSKACVELKEEILQNVK